MDLDKDELLYRPGLDRGMDVLTPLNRRPAATRHMVELLLDHGSNPDLAIAPGASHYIMRARRIIGRSLGYCSTVEGI